MTLNDLTVNIEHLQRETILSDWVWFIGTRKLPVLVTALGNVFVQDLDNDQVQLLDVGAPDLISVAGSSGEFQNLLSEKEFVLRFFDVGLVAELLKLGPLPAGKVFGFKLPPVMGGKYEVENFDATDTEVHFSLLGQLQKKVAGMPPGQRIGPISIN